MSARFTRAERASNRPREFILKEPPQRRRSITSRRPSAGKGRKIFKIKSRSPAETKKIAGRLGRRLGPGDVVTLQGELGAGKTTFAKGLAKALGVRSENEVSSPTFVIIHEYEARHQIAGGQARMPIYHLDWYRLVHVEGADRELAEECLDGRAVTFIEWPERGKELLPDRRIEVHLAHAGDSTREIEIRALGKKLEL